MISRWAHLKDDALQLRKRGRSIKEIRSKLGVPLSTLSGWVRNVSLSAGQRKRLHKRWREGLVAARVAAVKWHNAQKAVRMEEAKRAAMTVLNEIPKSAWAVELALAMLYLGEGSKTNGQTTLASSDSRIARFFIQSVRRLYNVLPTDIKCHLHLRADQDPKRLTRYWARELGLRTSNFGKPLIDKRTIKSTTYPRYKGVCAIRCGRVAIQRRLMYIANGFCDTLAERFR